MAEHNGNVIRFSRSRVPRADNSRAINVLGLEDRALAVAGSGKMCVVLREVAT